MRKADVIGSLLLLRWPFMDFVLAYGFISRLQEEGRKGKEDLVWEEREKKDEGKWMIALVLCPLSPPRAGTERPIHHPPTHNSSHTYR